MPYVVYDGTGGGSSLIADTLRVVLTAFFWGTTGLFVIGLASRGLGIENVFSTIVPGREFLDRGWATIPDIFGMWQQFFAEVTFTGFALLAGFLIAGLAMVFVLPRRIVWLMGLVPPAAFWLLAGVGFPLSELPYFNTDAVTLLVGLAVFMLFGLGTVSMLKNLMPGETRP